MEKVSGPANSRWPWYSVPSIFRTVSLPPTGTALTWSLILGCGVAPRGYTWITARNSAKIRAAPTSHPPNYMLRKAEISKDHYACDDADRKNLPRQRNLWVTDA